MECRTLTAPPDVFDGPISLFVDQYVAPNFPRADQLIGWTEALLAYHLERAEPVCIVRGHRRGALRRESGVRIVDSDNAPGIWALLRCSDDRILPDQLADLLDTGTVPVLMALPRDQRPAWSYGQAMSGADKSALWSIHLKHCHIFPSNPRLARLSARQLALRNLCPANHFLFPTPRSFTMERMDWSESPTVADLGESERVLGWVLHRLAFHVGSRADVLTRFANAVGGTVAASRPTDGLIRIRRKEKISNVAASVTVGADTTTEVVSSFDSALKRWTLNAIHGYYVATGLKQPILNVALSYKGPDGRVGDVGVFRLDLRTLATAGAVTKRCVDGEDLFDVRIVRDSDVSYWLTIRNSVRVRLQ